MSRRTLFILLLWLLAMMVALSLDARIAEYVHHSRLGVAVKGKTWAEVLKEPGEIRFTVFIVLLLGITQKIRWRQALFVLLSGAVSGLNFLPKWIVGRMRPFKLDSAHPTPFTLQPFWYGVKGLFNEKDLSFPSGHECTAGALAVAIWIVWPTGRWLFIALALVVGIERVIENAHYPSDVIGAMGFALAGTSLLYLAMTRWLKPETRNQKSESMPQTRMSE